VSQRNHADLDPQWEGAFLSGYVPAHYKVQRQCVGLWLCGGNAEAVCWANAIVQLPTVDECIYHCEG